MSAWRDRPSPSWRATVGRSARAAPRPSSATRRARGPPATAASTAMTRGTWIPSRVPRAAGAAVRRPCPHTAPARSGTSNSTSTASSPTSRVPTPALATWRANSSAGDPRRRRPTRTTASVTLAREPREGFAGVDPRRGSSPGPHIADAGPRRNATRQASSTTRTAAATWTRSECARHLYVPRPRAVASTHVISGTDPARVPTRRVYVSTTATAYPASTSWRSSGRQRRPPAPQSQRGRAGTRGADHDPRGAGGGRDRRAPAGGTPHRHSLACGLEAGRGPELSIEAMAWAFRQNIPKPGAKLVLLALCDFADEAWSCFPGQATLAAKTSQGELHGSPASEWLEEEGFIVSHARFSDGRRTSNRYTIHAPRPQTPPPSSSPSPGSGAPVPKAARGGKQDGGKRTKQAAKTATGQSDQRPDSAGEPAKMAGNRQRTTRETTPYPRRTVTAATGRGGCAAHPDSPAANRRSCGTSPRARRAAAAAREKREKRPARPATGTAAGSRSSGNVAPAPRTRSPRCRGAAAPRPRARPSGAIAP